VGGERQQRCCGQRDLHESHQTAPEIESEHVAFNEQIEPLETS
jgi:hypothetical protein